MPNSDPMGLVNAGGAQGALAALRQLIADKLAAEDRARRAQVEDRNFGLQNRTLDLNEQYRRDDLGVREQQRRDTLAEQERQHKATEADRTFKEDQTINESVPAGAELSDRSPIYGRLERIGALRPKPMELDVPPALAADPNGSQELPGTIAGGPVLSGRLFKKNATAAQKNTETDNARQAADLKQKGEQQDWKNGIAQQLADLKAGQAPKDKFGDWKQQYDYELAHPKAAAGGTQGLQRARADSAVQMLDRLQQVHSQLNAGEGPGQLLKGFTQKVKGALNMENAATEYQKLRRATAVALAVAIQGSRPSDADAEAMAQLLPDYNTPGEVAGHLFESTRGQLRATSDAMAGGSGQPNGQPKPMPSHGKPDPLGIR